MADNRTSDKLADALEAEGLDAMATAARQGHYDDYRGPLAFPLMALVNDLREAGRDADPAKADRLAALISRVVNGDFDGTKEEADEWAQSHEGRQAFEELIQPNRAERRRQARRGRHGR